MQGKGHTEVDSASFEWNGNDVFVVPSWHWYRNINAANDDLILFSVSDSPALEKLGFFRSQAKSQAGDIVDLVTDYRGILNDRRRHINPDDAHIIR